MTKNSNSSFIGAAVLAFGLLFALSEQGFVSAFIFGSQICSRSKPNQPLRKPMIDGSETPTAMRNAPRGDDSGSTSGKQPKRSFLEQAALDGADKIALLSLEERTRRAWLAEVTEDRMILLMDELELLLGPDGMPINEEDREEVVVLAREVKALRERYKLLVSGEPCALLDTLNGKSDDTLGENE
jgi:hypothetical protein